ncbi:MAG: SpoIIE family protein phosphatase [Acidobacteriota bacterium]
MSPPAAGRVLIAEDVSVNRRLLRGFLVRAGFEVIEAADGAAALSLARELQPDLVLLDIMMPGVDGYEVCRSLKAAPATRHTPVIFLTAIDELDSKVLGFELGAADYITKPFNNAEVVARVRTHVELRRVTGALERANSELHAKQQLLEEDLEAAGTILQSLLPEKSLQLPSLEVAWRFRPSERIGGDLLNVLPLDDSRVALYVADVSGHGVPAALVAFSIDQSLARGPGESGRRLPLAQPADLLRALDHDYPLERFDKHFTISYLVLDTTTGNLTYSSAGHPAPLIQRRDGRLELLEAGGPFIGLGEFLDFDEGSSSLAPGDRIVLYTDGLIERSAPDGQLFGNDRLQQLVRDQQREPLDTLCESILSEVDRFAAGQPARDDLTLLAVERRSAQEPAP